MSSTNRGDRRNTTDFYETPGWCVRRLVEKCDLPAGDWLEPGAGHGAIIKAVNRLDVRWTALELNESARPHLDAVAQETVITADFLSFDTASHPLHGREFAVAFGNPPYSLGQRFIQKSLEYAHLVCFLMPTQFLASQERSAWMQQHVPDMFLLPDRPSFTGKGTDSTTYGWFVWTREPREYGAVTMLGHTPKAERR